MSIVIDCKCIGKKPNELNEFGQRAGDIQAMTDPVVLRFLQRRAVSTYRTKSYDETRIQYKFGGRNTHQCVEKADAKELLSRRRHKAALFAVERNYTQPEYKAPEAGELGDLAPHPSDPFAPKPVVAPAVTIDPETLADRIAEFVELDGIGAKTATALAERGYSIAEFAQLDPTDVLKVAEIATKATVAAALVVRAIEGAKLAAESLEPDPLAEPADDGEPDA